MLAGPATNLAAALEFRGMKELIAAKIKYLVVAGGAFPSGAAEAQHEGRYRRREEGVRRMADADYRGGHVRWATAFEFPGASIDKEFAAANPDNPVADAYRAWKPMPYDTPVRGDGGRAVRRASERRLLQDLRSRHHHGA